MLAHFGIGPEACRRRDPVLQHVRKEDRADHQIEGALHALAPDGISREGQHQQRHRRKADRQKRRLSRRILRQHPPHHAFKAQRDANRQRRHERRHKGLTIIRLSQQNRKHRIAKKQDRARHIERPRQRRQILKQAQKQAEQVKWIAVHGEHPPCSAMILTDQEGRAGTENGPLGDIPVQVVRIYRPRAARSCTSAKA